MNDLIKSINIGATDILGMMLPGTMAVLVLSENGIYGEMIQAYLKLGGDKMNIVALLVVGYLVGMLFHTVSDLVERGMWECKLLDPRYWAARAVVAERNVDTTDLMASGTSWHRCLLRLLLAYVLSVTITVMLAATPFLEEICSKYLWHINLCNVFVGALIVFVGVLLPSTLIPCRKKNKDAMKIRNNTPWILVRVSQLHSNAKCSLFDSFRVMMRNLLWCMAFLKVSGNLGQIAEVLRGTVNVWWIYYAFLVAAFLRYLHNAYLKYKYVYEDYIYILEKEKTQPQDMNGTPPAPQCEAPSVPQAAEQVPST